MSFADNLKQLPKISHLSSIDLLDPEGAVVASIENKAGQIGSLTVYNHLAQTYGLITKEAARKGIDLFAEHAADALTNPGKHPNIDRLIAIEAGGEALRIKHRFAI